MYYIYLFFYYFCIYFFQLKVPLAPCSVSTVVLDRRRPGPSSPPTARRLPRAALARHGALCECAWEVGDLAIRLYRKWFVPGAWDPQGPAVADAAVWGPWGHGGDPCPACFPIPPLLDLANRSGLLKNSPS